LVVVPMTGKAQRQAALKVQSAGHLEYGRRATKFGRSEYRTELLENEGHDKEDGCDSGLIAFDIRPVSAGNSWRTVHNGLNILRGHRF
jgi:hypothetical protein